VKVRGRLHSESSRFHGSDCDAYWSPECDAVWSHRISHVFPQNLLPPSSAWKTEENTAVASEISVNFDHNIRLLISEHTREADNKILSIYRKTKPNPRK
jgi:hypothetical protein